MLYKHKVKVHCAMTASLFVPSCMTHSSSILYILNQTSSYMPSTMLNSLLTTDQFYWVDFGYVSCA